MAAQTSVLQVSVENDIREKATVALSAKGLSLSDAVRLFLLRVANDPAFPLELKVPNAETRAAMAEAEEIARTRRARLCHRRRIVCRLLKPAASKRAAPPRAADYSKTFLKDWERLSRSGRYDMNRLKEAMISLIANEAPLGPEWLDHP